MRISFSEFQQQFIPVKGIVNARDLGGYIIQDGRKLRDGVLIRDGTTQYIYVVTALNHFQRESTPVKCKVNL